MSVYSLTETHKRALAKGLKPCPFCGFRDIGVVESNLMRHVECRNCGASTKKSDNINEAVSLWNDRL